MCHKCSQSSNMLEYTNIPRLPHSHKVQNGTTILVRPELPNNHLADAKLLLLVTGGRHRVPVVLLSFCLVLSDFLDLFIFRQISLFHRQSLTSSISLMLPSTSPSAPINSAAASFLPICSAKSWTLFAFPVTWIFIVFFIFCVRLLPRRWEPPGSPPVFSLLAPFFCRSRR